MSDGTSNTNAVKTVGAGFKKFLKDSSGGTGMLFGVTIPIFFLIAGAAIDTAIISREQPVFYQAIDNAALTIAANELSVIPDGMAENDIAAREAQMKTLALNSIKANYQGTVKDMTSLDLDLTMTGTNVELEATLEIPVTVLGIFKGYGFDKAILKSKSNVQRAMRPVELTMVLDTTGSMQDDIDDLRVAARKFLSTLYGDVGSLRNMSSPFIRASLVPFSASVRLNPNAHDFSWNWIDTTGANPLSTINFTNSGTSTAWNNFTAWARLKSNVNPKPNLQWNGCVESRTARGPDGVNYFTSDVEPGLDNPHSLFPAYFNPDSASWYTGTSTRYPTNTSGSSTANGFWNNEYIDPYRNYSTTLDTYLTTGAGKKGFDDSVIGNNAYSMTSRWKNPAKYDGKEITPERYTTSGTTVTQNRGPWYNCVASPIAPLTHDRSLIEAGIDNMQAVGNTNIAEGLAWGMRVISPGAPFQTVQGFGAIPSEPISPYKGPRWQKFVLLMSDGENFAGSGFTDTGTAYNSLGAITTPSSDAAATGNLNRYRTTNINNVSTVLNSYTSTMCTNLKNNGVTIYAVGFRVDNPVLKACATSPAHYKFATSPAALVTYFDGIGKDVLNKMVYIAD